MITAMGEYGVEQRWAGLQCLASLSLWDRW